MKNVNEHRLAILSPVMTKALFSERSGLRDGQVRSQAERKNLPIFKIGRLSMVNVASLSWNGIAVDSHAVVICPTMTTEKFALASGLCEGQVACQISEGNIPSKRIGRLVLVDIASLYRNCLEHDSMCVTH